MNTNNIVLWEIKLNIPDWDCFKTLTLWEILKTRNRPQVEHCAYLESYICTNMLYVQEANKCVTHSSTESGIISLDAGLRMDGIPALDLWDLVIDVFHSNSNAKTEIQAGTGVTRRTVKHQRSE